MSSDLSSKELVTLLRDAHNYIYSMEWKSDGDHAKAQRICSALSRAIWQQPDEPRALQDADVQDVRAKVRESIRVLRSMHMNAAADDMTGLLQFYEWAMPEILERPAAPPSAVLRADLGNCREPGSFEQRMETFDRATRTAEPPKASYSESDVMVFLGYLSASLPELAAVEMGRFHNCWDEFLVRAGLTKSACTCPPGLCCERSGAAKSDQRICRDAGETSEPRCYNCADTGWRPSPDAPNGCSEPCECGASASENDG